MTGSTLTNFIPKIWSARFLQNFDKNMVMRGLCNTNYEGEISAYGDTVKIFRPDKQINIGDYTINTDISTVDNLSVTESTLAIDSAKYWAIQIDDIDRAQARAELLDIYTQRAAYELSDVIDKQLFALYTEAGTTIGSDSAPEDVSTPAKAYELMVKMAQKFDEKNIPQADRNVILSPAVYAKLLLDDRFVKVGSASSDATLHSGQVGTAAGFNIYKSNNVPNTAGQKQKIIALTHDAITFAGQLTEMDAVKQELRFNTLVKGLYVYGYKVLNPSCMICATVNV